MGARPLYSALSQQALLDPVKPAYNQSRPAGWLKWTASAFNWIWISMLAVLVTIPTVKQNLLHPLSASFLLLSIFCIVLFDTGKAYKTRLLYSAQSAVHVVYTEYYGIFSHTGLSVVRL